MYDTYTYICTYKAATGLLWAIYYSSERSAYYARLRESKKSPDFETIDTLKAALDA